MNTTALVETLTAEVRVLMVGNRQITLSVYRQLDRVSPFIIEPFGRVNAGIKTKDQWGGTDTADLEIVGRHPRTGALVRASMDSYGNYRVPDYDADEKRVIPREEGLEWSRRKNAEHKARYDQLLQLPLIVLAGLK